ncbi:MAG: YggS family pyridoxal phosphate-dependent enzyme [Chloroflexi bacterium]|nr:YggS family pyridoxal phosphate-dependent enzyme [Chloroflexota bacterium]
MNGGIQDRFHDVSSRIAGAERAAGRPTGSVRLVGVTKTVEPSRIRAAAEAGLAAIGENYVQEASQKAEALKDLELEWHLIGRLQSNKAKEARSLFQVMETIDRAPIAQALLRQPTVSGRPLEALVQVNLDGDDQRAGIEPGALPALLDELAAMDGLVLRGLMGVPPNRADVIEPERSFVLLRKLWEKGLQQIGTSANVRWDTLSMGMSGDFERAIAEGSTLVRIGRALFGPRQ